MAEASALTLTEFEPPCAAWAEATVPPPPWTESKMATSKAAPSTAEIRSLISPPQIRQVSACAPCCAGQSCVTQHDQTARGGWMESRFPYKSVHRHHRTHPDATPRPGLQPSQTSRGAVTGTSHDAKRVGRAAVSREANDLTAWLLVLTPFAIAGFACLLAFTSGVWSVLGLILLGLLAAAGIVCALGLTVLAVGLKKNMR